MESDLLPTSLENLQLYIKGAHILLSHQGLGGGWGHRVPQKYTLGSLKTVVVLKPAKEKRREKPSPVTLMILFSVLRAGHCWPLPVPGWPWIYTTLFLQHELTGTPLPSPLSSIYNSLENNKNNAVFFLNGHLEFSIVMYYPRAGNLRIQMQKGIFSSSTSAIWFLIGGHSYHWT